uniref:Protein kinase domain-containing protein n=1 Tax=Wuchereria bancrofti TaxID=6293 RepID=A0AAF5Q6V1_WUCBA
MEIAAGMKYLEQKQIVHGHLSPQCVLIDQNKMLYGIDDNATMYLELAPYGNVRQYLAHKPEINFLNKLQLVMEIAAGMKYLEQKQIVHGHLSPQCVLIDQNKMNKWSNKSDVWSFAATWEIFNDYTMIPFAKLTNAQLLENAKHIFSGHNANKWSNKSDVWSFAATWEIFNDYTMIPFAKLTNAQLLENAKHIFSGHNA